MACTGVELASLARAFGGDASAQQAAASFCEKLTVLNEQASITGRENSIFIKSQGSAFGSDLQWLIWAGALVFVMIGGNSVLCAGAIRSKNTMNTLLQTMLVASSSAIAFYLLGYGIAYGEGRTKSAFIGTGTFALVDLYPTHSWQDWFFQWTLAAFACSIPAGCVAERLHIVAFLAYAFYIPSLVFPLVAHWTWSPAGFLSARNNNSILDHGFVDFGGAAVVHIVGGFAGLVVCLLMGPRLGRFDTTGRPVAMPGHSASLVVIGTILLWFGWYGFNTGPYAYILSATAASTAARSAVVTTLGASTGGLVNLLVCRLRTGAWDLIALCFGAIVGLVSVTAGCAVLPVWAAFVAGVGGVLVYQGAANVLLLKLKLDDPVNAVAMHGVTGVWSCLMVGLLADKDYVGQVFPDLKNPSGGLFFGDTRLFVCQLTGIVVVVTAAVVLMIPPFALLKALGMLRISPQEELSGQDFNQHGGAAYNYEPGVVLASKVPNYDFADSIHVATESISAAV